MTANPTISLDATSDARRTLEDIRHFLVTINRAIATQEGQSFPIDTSDYIEALDRILPGGPYTRPID
jgi:hypothetical protein